MTTTKERVKSRNLSRNARLAACIYSTPDAAEYVTLRGHANVRDDESIWPVTQAIVERYMEPEQVDALMRDPRT